MPALLVTALRFLFVAIVQTAAYVAASNVLERVVDYIRASLRNDGGLTEEETDDTLRNEVLDALVLIGVTVASLKTRIPLRLADKLGLQATTLTRKTLSAKAKAGIATAATKGALKSTAVKVFLGGLALSFANTLLWFPQLVQQFGDQAAFAPEQSNNYYERFFGVRPFMEPSTLESPPPFGKGEFTDYALSLEFGGVTGINDPFKNQSLPYSRKNLAELVFTLYGTNIVKGTKLTAKPMIAEVAKYLVIPGRSTTAPVSSSGNLVTPAPVSSTKVFIGALNQGRLSSATGFTPRPDDLILSVQELETALRNNLVPFLASALGRFVYETRIVSSVTTKDGFTQRGQAQQIVVGTNRDGTKKYKTVVNKFAVANIYFLGETGGRTKAARIVLGATDAVNFRPSVSDLGTLDLDVRKDISTSTTSAVSEVKQSRTVTALQQAPEAPLASKTFAKAESGVLGRLFRAGASNANPPPDQLYADTGKRIYLVSNLQAPGAGIYESAEEYLKDHENGKHYETTRARLLERYGVDFDKLPARNPADLIQTAIQSGYETQKQYDPGIGDVQNPIYIAASVPELLELAAGADTTRAVGVGRACEAETLKAFFEARGQSLPSVETRSVLYEQYGLGSRGFYTGTTEQNAKLLTELQRQAGCPV